MGVALVWCSLLFIAFLVTVSQGLGEVIHGGQLLNTSSSPQPIPADVLATLSQATGKYNILAVGDSLTEGGWVSACV